MEFLLHSQYDPPMTQQRTHGDAAGPSLTFIGHIETPYETQDDCPYTVNPGGPECRIVLDSPYAAGLTGLAAGERILVLYWLDRAKRDKPLVGVRRSGKVGAGAFAARTPNRPNPIGAAVVTIEALEGPVVTVRGVSLRDRHAAARSQAGIAGGGAGRRFGSVTAAAPLGANWLDRRHFGRDQGHYRQGPLSGALAHLHGEDPSGRLGASLSQC